jgi:FlaA1/EpsC-like NDP-sugar epimerase
MSFAGKSVMVTGAGGSIGSQLCEQFIRGGVRKLTMVSLTENGLYNLEKKLRPRRGETDLAPVLGSVADSCLMMQALDGVDIVVHAAAHKHVPMCEQNPVEAIRNNVFGTETLAWASLYAGVQQFCLISSDKAVQPASIMGATKRVAELVVRRAGLETTGAFFVVRFGNVMDSAGSVLPLWREQIRAGGPITITDKRCERYFMSIDEAVRLVTSVIASEPKRGTFVLDMGKPRLLIDMAYELMMQEWGDVFPVEYIGLRPGEKLTEELHYGGHLVETRVKGVRRVEEPPGALPDPDKLQALEDACLDCDAEAAKALLWELAR